MQENNDAMAVSSRAETSLPYPLQPNVDALYSLIKLVESIETADYVKVNGHESSGVVGAHVRHVIEHYQCFTKGMQTGTIDYDQRPRNELLERDTVAAALALRECVQDLENLHHQGTHSLISVVMDCGGCAEEAKRPCPSSFGRELQFLLSHTVHHQALIALLLGNQLTQDPSFGIAPSTLRAGRG